MKSIIALSALFLLTVQPMAAAPSVVKLSGTVTKSGGGPLKGVTVALKSASGIPSITGTDGKFTIVVGSTGLLRGLPSTQSRLTIVVSGSNLVLSTSQGGLTGTVDIYSATGTRIHSRGLSGQNPSLSSLPLELFTNGMNVIRVTAGETTYLRSLLKIQNRLILKDESFENTIFEPATLARQAAAAAVDSLVATKAGFKDKSTPITSYIDSNLTISMDSAVPGTCPAPKAGTSKSNPIFTDKYSADPGVMVDNCTFYIQAGHDEGTGGFVMNEWFLYKSTDMVTWTRTTAMNLKIFAWTNANAWAGQMIHAKNGKFYWYVPINDIKYSKDRMAIGVAVADSPEGPWKDALGKPLINDSLEMATWNITNIDQTPHTIDPTVFIDDDGQAYLQYGGFWTMVSVKLNPDMISLGSKLVKSTPLDYFESPYLIKRNGIYYQIYARGSANPTTIDYATSTNPQGPWTWRGQILDKMPKAAGQDEPTNHAGVGEFAGQWYIVYHVSNGPNGGGTYKREVAIDKMYFNDDGTIKPVKPSTGLAF